jgi:hydroxymethylbilane synthase
MRLVLGTRGSALALAQAGSVRTRLQAANPGLECVISVIVSRADQEPQRPLAAFSGEGVFVKELEQALRHGRIDLAVHSLKDVPIAASAGLTLTAVLRRDEARDALVSRSGVFLDALPQGACIATGSLRRQSQLLARRPDIRVKPVRGNVDTRLRKLQEGQFDAILLAACGLQRLGLASRITQMLDPSWMLPEPGQGALVVQTRTEDEATIAAVGKLEDPPTRRCVEAERAFLEALGGGCRVPIAAYAVEESGGLRVDGAVVAADGKRQLRGRLEGTAAWPQALGRQLAEQLIAQGALGLLKI